jgi:hypothetical protein
MKDLIDKEKYVQKIQHLLKLKFLLKPTLEIKISFEANSERI